MSDYIIFDRAQALRDRRKLQIIARLRELADQAEAQPDTREGLVEVVVIGCKIERICREMERLLAKDKAARRNQERRNP